MIISLLRSLAQSGLPAKIFNFFILKYFFVLDICLSGEPPLSLHISWTPPPDTKVANPKRVYAFLVAVFVIKQSLPHCNLTNLCNLFVLFATLPADFSCRYRRLNVLTREVFPCSLASASPSQSSKASPWRACTTNHR